MKVKQKLNEILKAIKAENISYAEIAFLQDHKNEIKKFFPGESLLWEWAGIDENEYNNK